MAKRYEIQETPFGICSDPNVLKAPQGALKECVNAEIRRDGIVSPVNGCDKVSVSGTQMAYVHRMFNFDDDLLLYCEYTDYFEFLGNLGSELQDEDSGHPLFFQNYNNVQEARGNLYVACQDGVRKVTGSDSTDLYRAGLTHDLVLTSPAHSDASDWFADTEYVTYRVTLQRKDENNVVIESPSSHVVGVYNDSGSAQGVDLSIGMSNYVVAGDVIRVFRTYSSTGSYDVLGDSFYLVHEHTVTSTDVSYGYYAFSDEVANKDLRESLYTNPENEGILQSNYRPPVAKCVSEYKKSTFYSNVIEPPRVIFRMKNSYSDLVGESTEAGIRTTTCTTASGTPNLSAITDDTGLQVGQQVYGEYIPTGTYLISVSGAGTAVMSKNATGTSATDRLFVDTITFGYGSTYYTTWANKAGVHTAEGLLVNMLFSSWDYQTDEYTASLLDNYYSEETIWNTVQVERRTLNSSPFYVWATHGESYEPTLSGPTYSGGFVFSTANGLLSDMIVKPNREYWSKSDQPEHVPIVNWHDIGGSEAIIQAVETKDGRIVFKDDGIFTVTGEGAYSGWSVRKIDSEHILVTPDAVVAVGEAAYALTNRGLVRVTIYGVEPISRPYINYEAGDNRSANTVAMLDTALMAILNARIAGTTTRGCFVEYDPKKNRVLFTIPYHITYALDIWLYNLDTRSFSRINYNDDTLYHVLSNVSDSYTLYIAGANIVEPGLLYKDNGISGGLYTRTRTVSTKPDSTTINFTAAHNASAGDIVTDGVYRAIISAVIDADSVTVDDNTGISGSCVIYTPMEAVIRWMPKFGETRAFKKNFVAYQFMFDTLNEYSGSSGDIDSYEVDFQDGGTTYGPFDITDSSVRGLVPASEARSHILELAIRITQVNRFWQLSGMGIEYFLQAPRGTA